MSREERIGKRVVFEVFRFGIFSVILNLFQNLSFILFVILNLFQDLFSRACATLDGRLLSSWRK